MAAGKMRNAKLACKLHVKKASIKRKPRHADNALVAISHIFIEDHEKVAKFFPIEHLHATIRRLHEQSRDPQKLGRYCERDLNSHLLKAMAKHNYIRMNDTRTHLRVTQVAGEMMIEIAAKINALSFSEPDANVALQKHRAHCDYFRQKLGTISRLTNKELEQRNDELERELAEHQQICPLHNPLSREGSVASVAESFVIYGLGDEDASLADPAPSSSSAPLPATPVRSQNPVNLQDAYRTPVSLPRRRSQTEPASPPPSPMRSRTSFVLNHDANDDMDVDDGPVAGPSGTSSHHQPPSNEELAAYRVHFGTVAGALMLQNPTFQSVQSTLRERLDKSAAKDELIRDLKNENVQQRKSYEFKLAEQSADMTILGYIHSEEMQDVMDERDKYSHAATMSAQEAETIRQDLREEIAVAAFLLSEQSVALEGLRQELKEELAKSKKLAEDLSQQLAQHTGVLYEKDKIIRDLAAQVAGLNEQVTSMQRLHNGYAQVSRDNRAQMEQDLKDAKDNIRRLEQKQDELVKFIKAEQETREEERRRRTEDEAKRTEELKELLSL
ncbi:hypothetical protein Hypma_003721 [Hypsizygus marmoreus]|uniref:Uncharacterized protein n=1 Tax=Hypsizygus marmoreus TaxID=39966 RepID=A0A369J193_HYPMA|nr:hypothetical protein Hypma_003721 [Hypsizygus marmoreus]